MRHYGDHNLYVTLGFNIIFYKFLLTTSSCISLYQIESNASFSTHISDIKVNSCDVFQTAEFY